MDSRRITADDGVALHVAVEGGGPDVVVLSGGPGCVHYLADQRIAPSGFRCWFPDPRGVAASGGGPHTMTRAVADLEAIRIALGVESWIVLGHSWGCDLGVRYALDHPEAVRGVVGMCGHGFHNDRGWSAAYEAGKSTQEQVPIDYVPEVHVELWASFKEDWLRSPDLWRRLADTPIPMSFVSAGGDIRPSWPMEQLAQLIPRGRFRIVPSVVHDFWATEPELWASTVTTECQELVTND
ncbi:alpha/beta fold hydrolase [Luteococcus sediminum]